MVDNGVTLVLAAGNSVGSYGHGASANVPGVILVSGVNQNNMCGPTNRARNQKIDLCAPSENISVLGTGNTYHSGWGGTSLAAPLVAGTIGLMLSINPCLTPADIEIILKATTDPIADGHLYPGLVGTGRLNAYKAVQMAAGYTPDITANTLWDTPKFVNGTFTVKSGNTLTITDKVKLGEGALIYVEPNAKLVVNSGHLTSSDCGNYWGGIRVLGTETQHQYPASHPTYQGKVELVNGAIMENARTAVSLSPGGVLVASNSTFHNCNRAAEFLKYRNFHINSGATMNNFSYFTKVNFLLNDDYIINSQYPNPSGAQVTLWDVNGVSFNACNFHDQRTNKQWDNGHGKGIYSIDAGYNVRGTCSATLYNGQTCPEQYLNRTVFKGFNYGVEATGSNITNAVNVDQTLFEDNVYGYAIRTLDNSVATRSKFFVGGGDVLGSELYHQGILAQRTSGYRLEENEISEATIPASGKRSLGIRVEDSGPFNNRTYRNTFINLNIGQQSAGENRASVSFRGLEFLCNQNTTKNHDILISPLYPRDPNFLGIRRYQGDLSLSAGNTFTNPVSNSLGHIRNGTNNTILYFHTGGNTQPTAISPNVYVQLADYANTCPTRFGGSSGGGSDLPLSASMRTTLSADQDDAEIAYLNLLYNYNQLIDGGNTPALLQEIQGTWSNDAWDMRDELLAHSPYLSEDALRAAAETGTMPQAMLLEVCLANPEATESHEFLDFLANDIPNPMPEYMLEMIVANWENRSAVTTLEGGMAKQTAVMADASNRLLTDLMLDSVKQTTVIRNWLSRRGTLLDSYSLADSYIEEGNYATAESILNAIPNNFELSDADVAEFYDYQSLVTLRKSAHNQGRTIMQLDSTEVSSLMYYAENATGRPATMAQNILCFGYGICYDTPAVIDESGSSSARKASTTDPKQLLAGFYNKVTVQPNPARDYATLAWELPLLEGTATLVVTDVTGREVTRHSITTKQGEWVCDTRRLKAGIYLYKITQGDLQLTGGRIAVVK